jgi:hypothetical protein
MLAGTATSPGLNISDMQQSGDSQIRPSEQRECTEVIVQTLLASKLEQDRKSVAVGTGAQWACPRAVRKSERNGNG